MICGAKEKPKAYFNHMQAKFSLRVALGNLECAGNADEVKMRIAALNVAKATELEGSYPATLRSLACSLVTSLASVQQVSG